MTTLILILVLLFLGFTIMLARVLKSGDNVDLTVDMKNWKMNVKKKAK